MRSILRFCGGIVAFSTLVCASYRDHPRNYVRTLRLDNTSTTSSPMTASSYLGLLVDTGASTTSTTLSSDSSSTFSTTPTTSSSDSSNSSTISNTFSWDLSSSSTASTISSSDSSPTFSITSTTSGLDSPNSSATSIDITSSQPGCKGVITYYGEIPPTVYDTTTVPFSVTVTASNVSVFTPPVYTPTPPCFKARVSAYYSQNHGGATLTGSKYTSTVYVTKKTPVLVVVPDTSPPPYFGSTPTTAPVQSPTSVPTNQGAGNGQSSGGANEENPAPPTPTSANVNGVPVMVLPSSSGVVVGGQVISVPPSGSKTTVIANGNTFTLEKSAIVGPSTTIAIAADQAGSPTPVTANGLTFKVGATQAIISGKTYALGAGAPTTTLTLGGQTVVVGPSGIGVPGQTIAPKKTTAVVTAGGVTLTYDKSEAIVGSSTYRIGLGASQTLITVNGKTISLGANGVGLSSSTILPYKITAAPSLSAVTADGVTFSVDPTEVIIGSSTFRIGPGAPTETIVTNGHTISIGPSGVGLGSTTVRPPTATAGLLVSGAASTIIDRLVGSFVLLVIPVLLGCFLV